MIRLFTTTFREADETRRLEYRRALEKNVACEAIDEIHLLDEGDNRLAPESGKITKHPIPGRPTYSRFFERVNCIAGEDDISIIANTDIYFDDDIRVVERYLKAAECYALTRWDVTEDRGPVLWYRRDSQDSWIFRGPIRPVHGDFPLGVPRCDNRIAHEIDAAGYRLLNPAFGIRSYHLHAEQREEYPQGLKEGFVPPPYRFIWPHNLIGFVRRTLFNLSQRELRVGYRLDGRRVRRLGRKLRRLFVPKRLEAALTRRLTGSGKRSRNG